MATKPQTNVKKKGDLRSIKDLSVGPIKVFLDSGRRDEQGELVMEEYENVAGEVELRPERDSEPFLEAVFYRKNYMTPQMEDKLKSIKVSEEYKERPLNSAAFSIEMLVASWDLTDDGKPVPPTAKAIVEHDVPSDVLFSVLEACYSHNRPPKALSGKLQNTSSQEE